MRTVTQIHNDPGQRFVHRKISAAITADALFRAKRLAQTFAYHNTSVLYGVMRIHLDISDCLYVEIKQTVL